MSKIKFALAMLLACVGSVSYSQNLILTGKINYFDLPETGKIYFVKNGESFNKANVVTFDKTKKYTFTMSLAKIKKEQINTLLFVLDSNFSKYGCYHTVNVGAIISSGEFEAGKDIKLQTNLLMDFNCSMSSYYGAKEDQKEQFVGSYSLNTGDTTRIVNIEESLYRYRSTLSKATADFMTEEYGSWDYDKTTHLFTISIWMQMNSKYGLMLSKQRTFQFEVLDENGKFTFTPKEGSATLIKL